MAQATVPDTPRETAKAKLKGTDQWIVFTLLYAAFVAVSIRVPYYSVILYSICILMCGIGLKYTCVTVDHRILLALVAFDVFCILSSAYHDGSIVNGIVGSGIIWTVVYVVLATLPDRALQLLRLLCGVTGGAMAAYSIVVYEIVQTWSIGGRMRGFYDSPNAYGIFLVLCWFALIGAKPKKTLFFEPLLLTAVALTLSMSSFLSLAVGVLVIFICSRPQKGTNAAIKTLLSRIARIATASSIGVCLYVCARLVRMQWLSWLLMAYLAVACLNWGKFTEYARESRRMTWTILGIAGIIAVVILFLRTGAPYTFLERLQMMSSGVKYTLENPWVGLGLGGWGVADLNDGGVFFGVEHVHNFFLAIGSEFGLPALLSTIAIVVFYFVKQGDAAGKGEGAALVTHCMLDTALFFMPISLLAAITLPRPRVLGRRLSPLVARTTLIALMILCLWILLG